MRHKDNNKYEAICKSAIEIINKEGFANTSIAKIAKSADISSSTIYVYFKNKDDMISKLYIKSKQELSHIILKDYDKKSPIKDSFKMMWFNYCDHLLKKSDKLEFCEQYSNSPFINDLVREEAMKYYKPMIDTLNRGIQEGIFKDISTVMFYAFTFQPISYLVKLHRNGKININNDEKEKAFEIAWEAVRA